MKPAPVPTPVFPLFTKIAFEKRLRYGRFIIPLSVKFFLPMIQINSQTD
jgi:hypothetical protein